MSSLLPSTGSAASIFAIWKSCFSQLPWIFYLPARVILLLGQTIILTWYVYGKVALKMYSLAVCIKYNYQMYGGTNIDSNIVIFMIQYVVYLALPTTALIYIILFDFKDCLLVFIYSINGIILPRSLSIQTVFAKYLYKFLGDHWGDNKCPICQQKFDAIIHPEYNAEIALICYHKFCENCIAQYEHRRESGNCPVCRCEYVKYGIKRKIRLDKPIQCGYFSIYVDWGKYGYYLLH
eukprot:23658_1